MRKFFIKLLHFGFVNIQNDTGVPGCVIFRGMGHMDQVGIDQNQAALLYMIGTVIKEKKPFSFCEKINLVFIVKMVETHIISTGTL